MNRLDAWLGGTLILLGIAVAAAASGYRVGFMVDPLGPRALPFLVSGLFLVSGGALVFRSRPWVGRLHSTVLAQNPEERDGKNEKDEGTSLGPQLAATVTLGLYALAIPVLGFVIATTLATGALARLFGSRWLPGVAVGLSFGLALWALFSAGFGLSLPVGIFFGGSL